MSDKLFYKLWRDALSQPDRDACKSLYRYQDLLGEIGNDENEIDATLSLIHSVAHLSVRDIIEISGLTQSAFAIKFCIPLRTVEDWATGKRKCADYIRLMFAKHFGLLGQGIV